MKLNKLFFAMIIFSEIQSSARTFAGFLDTSFGNNGTVSSSAPRTSDNFLGDLALDLNERIICVGQTLGAHFHFTLTCFLSNGVLDTTFGTNGYVVTDVTPGSGSACTSVAIDGQNRIVAAGDTGSASAAVIRYLSDGSLDTSFGTNGITITPFVDFFIVTQVGLDFEGRIVVIGYGEVDADPTLSNFYIIRYTSSGVLDTSFNGTGYLILDVITHGADAPYAFIVDQSNNIIVGGGSSSQVAVVKITSAGSLDTTFATSGVFRRSVSGLGDYANSLAFDLQGRIMVAGIAGNSFFALRLTANGLLDTSFGAGVGYVVYTFVGTTPQGGCQKIIVDPLGRLIMFGTEEIGRSPVFLIARALGDGTLDTSFGTQGSSHCSVDNTSSSCTAGATDSEGRMIIGGTVNENSDWGLARYTVDYSFNYYKAQFANQAIGLL